MNTLPNIYLAIMNDECSVAFILIPKSIINTELLKHSKPKSHWIVINYLNGYLPQILFICRAHLRLMISWMQITL